MTSPEASLLLAAARGAQGIDWARFLRLVDAHRAAPFAGGALAEAPAPVRDAIAARASAAGIRALRLSYALRSILDAFERRRIEALPLKGPLLAERLHGSVAGRDYDDLDLLVRPAAAQEACAAIEGLGYARVDRLPRSWERDLVRRIGVLLYRRPDGVEVDLHWRAAEHGWTDEGIWPRLARVPWGGIEVASLPDDLLLSYLCAHGGRHGWTRLSWIRDVAELLRQRAFDGRALERTAQESGALRAVALGIALAHDLLAAPLPSGWRARPAPGLVRGVVSALFAEERAPARGWRKAVLNWRLVEPAERAAYLMGRVRRLLTPTRLDYEWIRLPPGLSGLYHLVRPLRLAAHHIAGLGPR